MSHPTGALNVELAPRVLESLRIRDMERWWADTEKERQVRGENLSNCHFCHQKSHSD